MSSTIRNAKQSVSIQDTAAERWSRLYVDVRASYGRAAIQAALLLNGAASVALLAFLGNLAIAQQTKGLAGNFVTFKEAFVCFGIGVMLAASSSVVAFLIQNVAIAHPKDAEGRTGRRLRLVGNRNGRRVAFSFRSWNHRGGERSGQFNWSLDLTAQRQTDLQCMTSGLLPPPPRQRPGACLVFAYTSSKTASNS